MNLLVGLAIAAVTAFVFWKFFLPDLKENFRQIADYKREHGAAKSTAIWIGIIAYIVPGVWLMMKANWPDTCDHDGRGLIGMLKSLRCSPDLLSGGAIEIGLFVYLWLIPTAFLAVLIYLFFSKPRTTNSSIYSDDTEK